jgi:hypothetical protein
MGRMAVLAIAVMGLTLTLPAAAETTHSGKLVSVGSDGHEVTVKELGPWDGRHQMARTRSFTLTPTMTTIETLTRSTKAAPGAWLGGFRETPASVAALRPGQYVTIKAPTPPCARGHLGRGQHGARRRTGRDLLAEVGLVDDLDTVHLDGAAADFGLASRAIVHGQRAP